MNKNKKKLSEPVVAEEPKSYEKGIKIFFIAIIVLLYGKTLSYDFALDDELFIVNNPKVQQGIAGIGDAFTKGSLDHFIGSNFQLYRPVQISLFCIEKQFFGFNARGFHFVNLLLYCLVALTLYSLVKKLFPKLDRTYHVILITLFVVHPIHTEVVANIKSQDELLSALFNLAALNFLFRYQSNTSLKYIIAAIGSFILALFSKESSFAFVAIFPVSLYLLNNDSIRKSTLKSVPFFIAGLFFLLCRQAVVAGASNNETTVIENVLYGATDWQTVWGTKLEIAFYYLKMMCYPVPMSWDYSFNQIPLMTISETLPVLSFVLYLLIGLLIIFNLRKRPQMAFGFLFFIILILPTANIFFLNGTTFAERFLFLPSFGFIVGIAFLLIHLTQTNPQEIPSASKKYAVSIAAVLTLMSWMVASERIPDWKNNYAVFKSGAANSPNSSRTNIGLGTYYMNVAEASVGDTQQRMAYVDSAITYIEKSLKIYPENHSAAYKLGLIYSIIDKKEKSKHYYLQSIRSNPTNVQALNNLGAVYASESKFDSAYYHFEKAYKIDASNDMTMANLMIASFNMGQIDAAIAYGEEAVKKGLGNKKIYNILAEAHTRKGNIEKANHYNAQAQMAKQ